MHAVSDPEIGYLELLITFFFLDDRFRRDRYFELRRSLIGSLPHSRCWSAATAAASAGAPRHSASGPLPSRATSTSTGGSIIVSQLGEVDRCRIFNDDGFLVLGVSHPGGGL
jgi:hypothetical protein